MRLIHSEVLQVAKGCAHKIFLSRREVEFIKSSFGVTNRIRDPQRNKSVMFAIGTENVRAQSSSFLALIGAAGLAMLCRCLAKRITVTVSALRGQICKSTHGQPEKLVLCELDDAPPVVVWDKGER